MSQSLGPLGSPLVVQLWLCVATHVALYMPVLRNTILTENDPKKRKEKQTLLVVHNRQCRVCAYGRVVALRCAKRDDPLSMLHIFVNRLWGGGWGRWGPCPMTQLVAAVVVAQNATGFILTGGFFFSMKKCNTFVKLA